MCHICCSLFFHPRTVILSNTKCNHVNLYIQMDVLCSTNCPLQINTHRNAATKASTNHNLHGKEDHNISFLQQEATTNKNVMRNTNDSDNSWCLIRYFCILKKQKEKFSGNQRTIRHVSGARHGWDINELPAESKN
jgi:hypothetical protein